MDRYGSLPDSVLYALVDAIGNFDLDTAEKMGSVQWLRTREISEFPGGVVSDVTEVTEEIRKARS